MSELIIDDAPAKLVLDPSVLTWADWEVLEDWQNGKVAAKATRAIIVRASGWTDKQVLALSSDAMARAVRALGNALNESVNSKN